MFATLLRLRQAVFNAPRDTILRTLRAAWLLAPIGLIAFSCSFAAYENYRGWRHWLRSAPIEDEITAYERRLASVAESLPPHGRYGFRQEKPADSSLNDDDYAKLFYMAQYALAPRVLCRDGKFAMHIVNRADDALLVRSRPFVVDEIAGRETRTPSAKPLAK